MPFIQNMSAVENHAAQDTRIEFCVKHVTQSQEQFFNIIFITNKTLYNLFYL